MNYCKPYKNAKPSDITQGFSDTHKANDWVSAYGTWLVAPFNGKVVAIQGADKLDSSDFEMERGCGIRILSIENPEIGFCYWHTLEFFPVKVGDTVLQGQPIAQMGNTGFVYSNGGYVLIKNRLDGNHPGTHAHISCGTQEEYFDYSKLIDWSIEVKYDLLTTISAVIQNIINFLKK